MNDFRCYSCWGLTGYRGVKQNISCPRCDAELFAGSLKWDEIDGIKTPLEKYRGLLKALQVRLAKNAGIYQGRTDVIANDRTRHKPDAIYYRCGSIYSTQPIIYEVVTNGTATNFDKILISRCRLFAETARNRMSQFYLVMPGTNNGGAGQLKIETVLKDNDIRVTGIIIIDDAEMNI